MVEKHGNISPQDAELSSKVWPILEIEENRIQIQYTGLKFNTGKGVIATAHNAELHAPETSGCRDWRLNITGADIGIHLLFPFILGWKLFLH